ncbi:MAG: cyanophycinase [Bryobacterales bacterium]|nr:cyanophycinase [Bryobacterales bacterium]
MTGLVFLLFCAGALFAQPSYEYFATGNPADVVAKSTRGFLLAGGGKDVDEGVRWFLERANGGDVVVLRASGTNAYNPYFMGLAKVDSVETIIFKTEAAAREPFVLEKIRNAEAIFFAGGDQWNYVRYWANSPVAVALNEAIRRGVPVGGTSAGLAILGEFAFSAQRDTVTSPVALADPFDEHVTIHRGLLRIPGMECLITDSHFAKRDRMGRLLVFLGRMRAESACEVVRGIGIDERAAVTLDEQGQARVVGDGSAYLIQLRKKPAIARGRAAEIPRMDARAVPSGTAFAWGKWTGEYGLSVKGGDVKSTGAGIYGAR